MKRIVIFSLLGPPLGLLVAMWGLPNAFNWWLGDALNFSAGILVLTPLAYILGVVPAAAAGVIDGASAERGLRSRIAWTAMAGFALGFIPLLPAFASIFANSPIPIMFGLVGAAPAGFCSWLAGPRLPVTPPPRTMP